MGAIFDPVFLFTENKDITKVGFEMVDELHPKERIIFFYKMGGVSVKRLPLL